MLALPFCTLDALTRAALLLAHTAPLQAWALETHPHLSIVNPWLIAFGHQSYLSQLGAVAVLSRVSHRRPRCRLPRRRQEPARKLHRGRQHDAAFGAAAGALPRRRHRVVCSARLLACARAAQAKMYDASLKEGSEDWDLWLRLFNLGHWCAPVRDASRRSAHPKLSRAPQGHGRARVQLLVPHEVRGRLACVLLGQRGRCSPPGKWHTFHDGKPAFIAEMRRRYPHIYSEVQGLCAALRARSARPEL